MKKIIAFYAIVCLFLSCANPEEKKTEATTEPATTTTAAAAPVDLPYKATYSSNFTQDVPDAVLKATMDSYVFWTSGDMDKLASLMGDSVTVEMADGLSKSFTNAELKAFWKTHRDSISNVSIEMEAWTKMHSDKGDDIIATWYLEKDTYKTGKVDSAYYHDINLFKNGKMVYYSTFKKPKK